MRDSIRTMHLMQSAKQGPRLRKPRAVSFDAAGTLIAPAPSVGHVYAEVLAAHGIASEAESLEAAFLRVFSPWRREHPDTVLNRATWEEIVRQTLGALCPPEKFPEVFDHLWNTFEEAHRWRILPSVEKTLATLKAAGYRLAVLSNNDERLHRVLDALTLSRFFEVVLVSTEIGVEKPDLRAFRALEEAMSLPPESFLHVGDRAIEDASGAMAAGWQAVLLGSQQSAPPGSFAIADFSELCEVLHLS